MRPSRPAPSRWVLRVVLLPGTVTVSGPALQPLAGGPRSGLQAKVNFGNSVTRGKGAKAGENFLQAGLSPPSSLLVNL